MKAVPQTRVADVYRWNIIVGGDHTEIDNLHVHTGYQSEGLQHPYLKLERE